MTTVLRRRTPLLTGQVARFVLAGALNTLLSYVIYWCLLRAVDYRVAYATSYVATILTGFAFNTWFVFRTTWSWRKLAMFPGVYLVNFFVGLGIVWMCISLLGLPAEVAPIVATLAVVPLGFVMTRLLLGAPSRSS
ncbi:GtrA family protein [Lysobacter sp. TY2-98]|uniref:GtrA family protein n=1 Tax=Lysobacter sp. TY2-98 TaxID=2290922 RepID=UPI0013B406B8|nr:GtrA family protein [Lysobacter sp. TY2-98]